MVLLLPNKPSLHDSFGLPSSHSPPPAKPTMHQKAAYTLMSWVVPALFATVGAQLERHDCTSGSCALCVLCVLCALCALSGGPA